MTFRETQEALLADLQEERKTAIGGWAYRLDQKIGDMREAIYGSRSGDTTGRSAGVQDVPGGDAQTLR